MNTHGGQLSFGQSGAAGGASQLVEAVLQVQRRSDDRQVPDCNTVYINGNGGIMSEQVSVIVQGG
jgi:acetyl-CoA acetyltransferase